MNPGRNEPGTQRHAPVSERIGNSIRCANSHLRACRHPGNLAHIFILCLSSLCTTCKYNSSHRMKLGGSVTLNTSECPPRIAPWSCLCMQQPYPVQIGSDKQFLSKLNLRFYISDALVTLKWRQEYITRRTCLINIHSWSMDCLFFTLVELWDSYRYWEREREIERERELIFNVQSTMTVISGRNTVCQNTTY